MTCARHGTACKAPARRRVRRLAHARTCHARRRNCDVASCPLHAQARRFVVWRRVVASVCVSIDLAHWRACTAHALTRRNAPPPRAARRVLHAVRCTLNAACCVACVAHAARLVRRCNRASRLAQHSGGERPPLPPTACGRAVGLDRPTGAGRRSSDHAERELRRVRGGRWRLGGKGG